MNTEQEIKNKILAYFNGSLSSADEATLENWLKRDSRNQDLFFKMKDELNPEKMEHDLLDESLAQLRNRIFIDKQFRTKKQDRGRKLYLRFTQIAASILLFIGLSFAFSRILTNFHHEDTVWFTANTSRGEKTKLMLPDGSQVWLNSESSITFPNNFLDANRVVKLTGEAYFEIEKSKGMPFTVKTQAYDVRVLGTKFNVMAYNDFHRTETSLVEGHVEIHKGSQVVDLQPGQMLSYENKEFVVKEVNTARASYWKDGKFNFDQVTFKELVVRLERWYDVDIKMDDERLNDILYSGVFKNEETIWQVLNSIQMTLPIKYHRSGFREFVIERK